MRSDYPYGSLKLAFPHERSRFPLVRHRSNHAPVSATPTSGRSGAAPIQLMSCSGKDINFRSFFVIGVKDTVDFDMALMV